MPGRMTHPADDGTDVQWVITHGANMSWRYARSVQPALADMEAALETEAWGLCVGACAMALLAMAFCRAVGAGLSGVPSPVELHLRMAVDPGPDAVALRALPSPSDADGPTAHEAAAVVRELDAELRRVLPFEMPVIRKAGGRAPSIRITGEIARWRAERNLGPVDWNRSAL